MSVKFVIRSIVYEYIHGAGKQIIRKMRKRSFRTSPAGIWKYCLD
jgi:hypothetical protein